MLISGILKGISECDFACDGQEGYDKFADAHILGMPYDLICLDISMPNQNGHETLQQIRRYEEQHKIDYKKQVKIIMTTAMNDPVNVFGAFKAGCEEYLVKPLDKDKLLNKVQELGLLTVNAG